MADRPKDIEGVADQLVAHWDSLIPYDSAGQQLRRVFMGAGVQA